MCGQQREDKINNNLQVNSKCSPYISESGRFSITSDLTDDDLSKSDSLDSDPAGDELECCMHPFANKQNNLACEISGHERCKNQKQRDQNRYREEMKLSSELNLVDIALQSRAKIIEKKRKILKKYQRKR